jgi:mRNA-degrading endonuclease toxin of MazEF toxin-antitoxin module
VNDQELAKVKRGSIVHGAFPGSNGRPTKTPHYAIVIDNPKDFADPHVARIVGISTSSANDDARNLLQLPGLRLPRKSYAHCDWLEKISLDAPSTTLHTHSVYGPVLDAILLRVIEIAGPTQP